VQFPAAELHFQQSAVSQPMTDGKPAITVVWSGARQRWSAWEALAGGQLDGQPNAGLAPNLGLAYLRQEICYERVAWNFWVRTNGANMRATCKLAADRLAGLLGNRGETHALGAKGICRLKPSAPVPIQDADYCLRLVTCAGTLRYPILSQVQAQG
jgi:hypothetical protein